MYRRIPYTLREVRNLVGSQIKLSSNTHGVATRHRGRKRGGSPIPYCFHDRDSLLSSYGSRHCRTRAEKDRDRQRQASPWNVANMVTCGRIAIAPVIGYWIMNNEYDLALGGLMFAAISDWLDGVLARRLKLHTVIGSYMDPAADKLLITISSVGLASQQIIPMWLVSLIISRDVGLITGWIALTRRSNPHASFQDLVQVIQRSAMEPILISKLNTSFQIALAFAGVLNAGEMGTLSNGTLQTIGLATAATTCASGLAYGRQFYTRWNHL
ncbi:CDP-alcohol phosphatidyltransferase [Gracilaria domingensis]|nr:CDP-alcohol phosphatidyltransferase [Gracilaria domingensis]